MIKKETVWSILEEIPDPEIPVISIVELGITRDVHIDGDSVTVDITPTYSGCPAMGVIEKDIIGKLKAAGVENPKIKVVYSPVWTTDWLNDEAKEKLRKYGIAPPEKASHDKSLLTGKPKIIACPYCGSGKTKLISQFGSTACKALYKCENCLEPFDYFKCH
ncbi:MAG TPA: phenylacetate-CoA oxygenase subunit PaaJ [Bacteroidia bacterium]|nr:phenylacetate-CoA oxygenase subunit PaaJ [Bacteroidia bacterium]HNS12671.1 phenylacetate-CoA oxygenase subunit PaaJ [Bacteroidia bacterium]